MLTGVRKRQSLSILPAFLGRGRPTANTFCIRPRQESCFSGRSPEEERRSRSALAAVRLGMANCLQTGGTSPTRPTSLAETRSICSRCPLRQAGSWCLPTEDPRREGVVRVVSCFSSQVVPAEIGQLAER